VAERRATSVDEKTQTSRPRQTADLHRMRQTDRQTDRQTTIATVLLYINVCTQTDKTEKHTHNRFTAGLEYVRVNPGQQVPER